MSRRQPSATPAPGVLSTSKAGGTPVAQASTVRPSTQNDDDLTSLSADEIALHPLLPRLLPYARDAQSRLEKQDIQEIGGFPFPAKSEGVLVKMDSTEGLLLLERMASLLEDSRHLSEENLKVIHAALAVGILCGQQELAGLMMLQKGDVGHHAKICILYRRNRRSGIKPTKNMDMIAEREHMSRKQVRNIVGKMPDFKKRPYRHARP